jgi:hypothetical protein
VARTQAVYYRDRHGAEPVNEFIERLPAKRAAKIDDYVEEYLNGRSPQAPPPEFPISSQIDSELRELRVQLCQHAIPGALPAVGEPRGAVAGDREDTGAIDKSDMDLAKRRMADFKRRMDTAKRVPPRAVGKDAPPDSRRRG